MGLRVSDEVWQRLEPGRGQPRAARRLWIAAAALLVLWCAGTMLWTSPLVTPQLNLVSPSDMSGLERAGDDLRVTAVIENPGPLAVTVLDVDLDGPGLEPLRVDAVPAGGALPIPSTLAAGARLSASLSFRVADCHAIDVRSPWLVRVTVQRPWGETVVSASASFTTHGPEEDLIDFWCGL